MGGHLLLLLPAPDSQLQHKSHRYYFAASPSLHQSQIYLSPMDLNWEHGKPVQPLEPAMRLITPVFDAEGHKRGLLVLNVLVESMMQRFMDKHVNFPLRSLLVNRQGEWLHDGKMAENWVFLLPDQPRKHFSAKFPETWASIDQQEHGQLVTPTQIQFEGKPAIQSVVRDITEQRKAEGALRLSHQRHELVKKRTASDADVQKKLHRIEEAGRRAAEMIRQLLAFARKEESELTVMPVQPFIKEILKLARSSIPENIALQHDLGEQDYRIRGDGSQMQQIMLNLLVNASHALDGRDAPAITVSMHRYEPDDDFLFVHREIESKSLLCITIADNGCGISKANLEHVFEPFFTTKAEGKGTGLGLAMVYGSMQNYGGAIDIESEEGTGTRMKLYFPLSTSTAATGGPEAVDVISGKDEVILMADDNEQVREIMQEILQDFGYRVMTAENGKQALLMYIDHASEISLALLDIAMPVMGGVEAAERLRELKPDLPILFLSGYEKGVSPSDKPGTHNITVLTKPVDLAELSHHIHKSINK